MAYVPKNIEFKYEITLASEFPSPLLVKDGWFFTILANVIDNDVTKTNTGKSFRANDEIVWFNNDWILIGEETTVLNVASVGTSGVSLLDGIVNKTANFRSVKANSNKLAITLDDTNNIVLFDFNNSNVDINSLSGILSIVKGGSGNSSFVTNGVVYFDGSKFNSTTIGTSGQLLQSTGGSSPIWKTSSVSNLSGTIVLRDSNGTTQFSDPTNPQEPVTKAYFEATSIYAKKYAETVNGLATSYTITHNLNNRDVVVSLYDNSTFEDIQAKITRNTVNSITVDFNGIMYGSDVRVVVIGIQN